MRDLATLDRIEKRQDETNARLARIERLLTFVLGVMDLEVSAIMATKATDQALIAEVHRNTDVAKAAQVALTTLSGNVKELTQKLADAVAGSEAADDPAVKAALDELKANNDATAAATPALSTAIANTDPKAAPPPAP